MAGSTDGRLERIALAIGFLALAGGVLLAHESPATGYEVSPYSHTPAAFWGAIAVAFVVAVGVSFTASDRWAFGLGLGLAGTAAAVVAAIPLLRGYHFYGLADGLTHLGWAADLRTGASSPFELIYPGIHSAGAVTAVISGLRDGRALLLVVLAFVVLFLLAAPLAVRAIAPSRRAVAVGTFTAAMLLPITHLSTHMNPHPVSQATLLAVLFVLLVIAYARAPGGAVPGLVVLLAVVAVGTTLYHPQVAIHLIGALLAASVLQLGWRLRGAMGQFRPAYVPTVLLGAAYLSWSAVHGFFAGAVSSALQAVTEFLVSDQAEAGEAVATQTGSLLAVGGSLVEVFVKLFLVSVLLCVATAALLVVVAWRRDESTSAVLSAHYLGIVAVGLAPPFVLYFVGAWGEMYFRVVGLGLAIVTVVGAVAIDRGAGGFAERSGLNPRPLLAIGLLAALALSLAVAFPSPYIYQPSPHVTEMQMSGHETAFENQYGEVPYAGVRGGPYRYTDAIYGGGRSTEYDESVPGPVLESSLATYFDDDRYVVVTRVDRQREVVAYRGLRYSETNFDGVDAQPGVHRVQTNPEFDLYYVRAGDDGTT